MSRNASLPDSQRGRSFSGTFSIKHTSRKYVQNKQTIAASDGEHKIQNSARSFREVGLPVLNLACDPKLNTIKRGMWGILWLASLIFCVVQCTNCFVYFADTPTVINVRYRRNMTIDLPCVTICPIHPNFKNPVISASLLKQHFGNVSYAEPYDLLLKPNLTIRQMWNMSSFSFSNLTYGLSTVANFTYGFVKYPDRAVQSDLLTVHGTCLTFKLKSTIPCLGTMTGMYVVMYGDVPYNDKNFVGLVHSKAETPLIRYVGTILAGFYGTYQHYTTVYLRVQEIIRVNTRRLPCQTEEDYVNCLVRCIERTIIAASTSAACRLPFMETMSSTIPPCTTAAEFNNMYAATDFAVRTFSDHTCGCNKPCREFQYWEDNLWKDQDNESLINFFVVMPHCDVEVVEETANYGFTNLFSDVGGSLGLFLGISILNIFELLDILFGKLVSLKRIFTKQH